MIEEKKNAGEEEEKKLSLLPLPSSSLKTKKRGNTKRYTSHM
jgi:hypothetical protein